MSAIIPIIGKDLRKYKTGLLILFVLLVSRGCIRFLGTQLMLSNVDHFLMTVYSDQVLRMLQGLLMIILIPLIVQNDSLVGTTAFWLTRPISRFTLMCSKAGLIFVLCVFCPMITDFFILLMEGFSFQMVVLTLSPLNGSSRTRSSGR